jgi:hypothetical protein
MIYPSELTLTSPGVWFITQIKHVNFWCFLIYFHYFSGMRVVGVQRRHQQRALTVKG